MSALYGTVIGQARTAANRRGSREITAAVRSWDGSVTVTMRKADKDTAPIVTIQVKEGCGVGGRTVWEGPLASLMLQGLLKEADLDDSAEDTPPLCALAMGCLCAAHAKGRAASGPCDAREDVQP